MKERTSLASIGGKDVFEKAFKFMAADNARKMGIYPFFRPLDFADGPEAQINGKRVVMFGSNNYLGLTTHPRVRDAAKAAIDKYGTSMTGACQKAAFRLFGSTTLTWQSYRPGGSLFSVRLNRSGSAFDFGSIPSVTASGGVSKALVCPW